MTDKMVRETLRQIQRAKIREPRDGQYVDVCHWSKTGWAIWDKDGICTCQPANEPVTCAAVGSPPTGERT